MAAKVLILMQGEKNPSARVRVLDLLPYLREQGLEVSIQLHARTLSQRMHLFTKLNHYDLVLVQKRLLPCLDTKLIGLLSHKLVFDFDDAIFYRHDSHAEMLSGGRSAKFRCMAKTVDLVIAGNEILAEAAQAYAKRVEIVPSAVEVEQAPVRDHSEQSGAVRIGWIGGANNLLHLASIAPILQRLAEQHNIEVRIISDRSIDIPGVNVRFVPWQLDRQLAEVAQLDIGVMPLPNNPHTQGKCAYKALQYMAAGVPPVVSDVGTNKNVVIHGQSGMVAAGEEAFFTGLLTLVENADLRRSMGQAARERAAAKYSLPVVGRQLARILRDTIEPH